MVTKASFAFVIVLVIYVALFSSISDLQLFRSLSFFQGTLKTWDSRTIMEGQQRTSSPGTIICDRSNAKYDLCSINGSCILDPKTRTLTLIDRTSATSSSFVEKIRPYPRKADNWIMTRIKELKLISGPLSTTHSCGITHDLPAIVFSAGGYTGSIYHDFIDGFIPLFITANSVYPDRDFILVVSESKEWWRMKYIDILSKLSKHKTILLDKENASVITYCFTSAIVGLIAYEPMKTDPIRVPYSESLVGFHKFLGKAFNSNISTVKTHKPRLILVSRCGNIGRVILNEKEIKEMLEDVGFEVITFRPSGTTNLREAYKLLKSSHGMVGVHGAALTHLWFLRPGSVFVQVVPVGLDWVKICFESEAKAIKLVYIEYPINVEESSLIEKYNRNDLVLKDPRAFRGMGWNASKMKVYLKEQDVRFDVNRFRKHMKKAYKTAKSFMEING